MQYTQHVLDRRTGDFASVDMGEWITVTELGRLHGVGPNKARTILHRMGLLRPEGTRHTRFRLTPEAVAQGLGKRHDKPRNGAFPFDVISPTGQALIADNWQGTLRQLEADEGGGPRLLEAKDALTAYVMQRSLHRLSEMTTQMRVSWLLDHFPEDLTSEQIARIVGVTRQLVSEYAGTRRKQREHLMRRKASDGPLPAPPPGLFAVVDIDTVTHLLAPETSYAFRR